MTTQNPDFELPPAEQAQQVREQIVAQAFFLKLAEVYGISPGTPEEADSLWRVGQRCLHVQQHPAVKQAVQQQSPLLQAERRLAELTAQYGFDPAKTAEDKAAHNQITLSLAQEPDVYKAMLSLAHAESQAAAS